MLFEEKQKSLNVMWQEMNDIKCQKFVWYSVPTMIMYDVQNSKFSYRIPF